MRYPASEKLEIIKLVEQSHLPVRRTLEKLGIARATFYHWYDLYRSGGKWTVEVTTLKGQLASTHIEHARQVIALKEKFETATSAWRQELASAKEELACAQEEIKNLRAVNEGHACKLKTYEGVRQFMEHIAAATREVR